MSTSIKKLLLVWVTALLGVMISGLTQAANPDVLLNVSGQSYDITYITGTYDANVALLSQQPWFGYATKAMAFATALSNAGTYVLGTPSDAGYPPYFAIGLNYGSGSWGNLYDAPVQNRDGSVILGTPEARWYTEGFAVVNTSAGAPEIDGSLAPKVGFLLGCLFLMFGRKRQNSEPMMTA